MAKYNGYDRERLDKMRNYQENSESIFSRILKVIR